MPPGTGQLTILLIIITLAESGVLGDLLEGLSGQCDAARSGFEGDGCFVKFTPRPLLLIINYLVLKFRSVRTIAFTSGPTCLCCHCRAH